MSWKYNQSQIDSITVSRGLDMSTGLNGLRPLQGNHWAGGAVPTQTTDGTNLDVVTTETYFSCITIPATIRSTGVAIMNGGAVAGNVQVALLDINSNVVCSTASTAASGTDGMQSIPWSAVTVLPGPASYFVAVQGNNTGMDLNTIILGSAGSPAGKVTSTTYGTFTSLTVPTTFTTGLGVIACLY